MFGLVAKLFSKKRASNTARTARRTRLQVECLEDRLMPAPVFSFNGPTLTINNIAPGHTIQLQCQQNNSNDLEAFDNGNLFASGIPKASLNTINLQGSAKNAVIVDDTYGMPFAQGTAINLSGGISTLKLQGARAVAGNESYTAGREIVEAGAVLEKPGTINLDNLTFTLRGIPTVIDELPISGILGITEYGNAVLTPGALNGVPGTAGLLGMGSGGGDTLFFSEKPNIILAPSASNTTTLLTFAPAPGESIFQVAMNAPGETTAIIQTLGLTGVTAQSGVPTYVFAYGSGDSVYVDGNQDDVGIWCYGSGDSVTIAANQAPVDIQGNSTTHVLIGYQEGTSDLYSTKYIQANIAVNGAAILAVNDSANQLYSSDVTVANGRISGFGLFGNNNVTVSYSDVFIVAVEWTQPRSPITI